MGVAADGAATEEVVVVDAEDVVVAGEVAAAGTIAKVSVCERA